MSQPYPPLRPILESVPRAGHAAGAVNHSLSATRLALSLAAIVAVCLLVAFSPTPAVAQSDSTPPQDSDATGAIEGRVATLDGTGVPGARVELIDIHERVRTDDNGRFRFDNLESKDYLVHAEALGVGQTNERVAVQADGTANVELTLQLMRHDDEVVVTGSAVARSQLELAQPTTVLSGEELRFRQQATLGDTLSQEAGISATTFGAGSSRPVIRGLSGDRVRMLQDGVGAGDASASSPDHAVSTEPAMAERIEVLRGPATLLYGSSAIGGVVNVLNGRIPDHRPDEELAGVVDLSGGTVADERAASASLNGGRGNWAWHVGGSYRDAEDYEIPGFASLEDEHSEEHGDEHGDEEHGEEEHEGEEHEGEDDDHDHEEEEENPFGVMPNSFVENQSATLGATRFFDRGFIGISVSGFESDYGIPGGHAHGHGEDEHGDEHDDEHGEEDHGDDDHGDEDHEGEEHEGEDEHGHGEEEGGVSIDMERVRYDLRAEITEPFGAFQGARFRLGIVDYEHTELEGEEREIGTQFFNDEWEGRFEMVQREVNGWSGSFGVQLRSRDFEAIGAEAFVPPNETESWSLFTFQEKKLPNEVLLQFGARYETEDITAKESDFGPRRSRDFDGVSASFGLVWEFTEGWALATSLARSEKLPNAEELFSGGPHLATNSFEVGNVDLDVETSLGLDLALRKTSGRVTGELTLFQNDFDDFIFQRFTGDEEDGLPVVAYTQADADFTGAELQARVGLWESGAEHLDLKLTGDVVRAELASGGYLPRTPPSRVSAGLHYHRPSWHIYAEVFDVAEQDRVAEEETPTAGYTLVNAGVSWRYLGDDRVWDVILRGRNLTDEEARNHVSFLKNDVPLPGRDVSLALRMTF